jgi:stalled ribosome alternative rescue factor ArfA
MHRQTNKNQKGQNNYQQQHHKQQQKIYSTEEYQLGRSALSVSPKPSYETLDTVR